MKKRFLDSWPILEWLKGSAAAEEVSDLLLEAAAGSTELWMSAINVDEVYYFLRKTSSAQAAETWKELAHTLPVGIEVPSLQDIWHAATLKSRYPIAYADAFAAALAQKHHCPLVTGDPEFHSIEGLELH